MLASFEPAFGSLVDFAYYRSNYITEKAKLFLKIVLYQNVRRLTPQKVFCTFKFTFSQK